MWALEPWYAVHDSGCCWIETSTEEALLQGKARLSEPSTLNPAALLAARPGSALLCGLSATESCTAWLECMLGPAHVLQSWGPGDSFSSAPLSSDNTGSQP